MRNFSKMQKEPKSFQLTFLLSTSYARRLSLIAGFTILAKYFFRWKSKVYFRCNTGKGGKFFEKNYFETLWISVAHDCGRIKLHYDCRCLGSQIACLCSFLYYGYPEYR